MVGKKTKSRRGKIRIVGPDRRGIIATITCYLYKHRANIEDIDQRIFEGTLVMNMLVDLSDVSIPFKQFERGLQKRAQQVGVVSEFQRVSPRKRKNVVVFVSKEDPCLTQIIKDVTKREINAKLCLVVSNHPDLEPLAKKIGIPFFFYPAQRKKEQELAILQRMKEMEVDLIVLARYMQILSPDFCFRFEGRIINIHPSLLPAFPGARAYEQAYHKGVEVIGVTAHFVTMDLDEGPIICQASFTIDKQKDRLSTIQQKGQALEARVLSRAVKLFCAEALSLRRGKVHIDRELSQKTKKIRAFYED